MRPDVWPRPGGRRRSVFDGLTAGAPAGRACRAESRCAIPLRPAPARTPFGSAALSPPRRSGQADSA